MSNEQLADTLALLQKGSNRQKVSLAAVIGAMLISAVAVAAQITTYRIRLEQIEIGQKKHEQREEKFADVFNNVDKLLERHTTMLEDINHRLDRMNAR